MKKAEGASQSNSGSSPRRVVFCSCKWPSKKLAQEFWFFGIPGNPLFAGLRKKRLTRCFAQSGSGQFSTAAKRLRPANQRDAQFPCNTMVVVPGRVSCGG